jgi:hypothetical protein
MGLSKKSTKKISAKIQKHQFIGLQKIDKWLNFGYYPIFSVFSNFEKIRYCPHFVCPSVRLSVRRATTFQGVDRSCSFMAQSIAYDPRA